MNPDEVLAEEYRLGWRSGHNDGGQRAILLLTPWLEHTIDCMFQRQLAALQESGDQPAVSDWRNQPCICGLDEVLRMITHE